VEDDEESIHSKRVRTESERRDLPADAASIAVARGSATGPEVDPDLGINTFLAKYFATHSAADLMFRDAVIKFMETKLDYASVDFADETLEEIEAAGGHHPDVRAVQTTVDQEVVFKFTRLLMSTTQAAGTLPDMMRYLGKIAADRHGVQLGPRFESALQNSLVKVGHDQVEEVRASRNDRCLSST
jgi:hypothetical protein